MVENPPGNTGDVSLIPGQRTKILHATEQLSPGTANYWTRILHSLCGTTGESVCWSERSRNDTMKMPRATTKTEHSQVNNTMLRGRTMLWTSGKWSGFHTGDKRSSFSYVVSATRSVCSIITSLALQGVGIYQEAAALGCLTFPYLSQGPWTSETPASSSQNSIKVTLVTETRFRFN